MLLWFEVVPISFNRPCKIDLDVFELICVFLSVCMLTAIKRDEFAKKNAIKDFHFHFFHILL